MLIVLNLSEENINLKIIFFFILENKFYCIIFVFLFLGPISIYLTHRYPLLAVTSGSLTRYGRRGRGRKTVPAHDRRR